MAKKKDKTKKKATLRPPKALRKRAYQAIKPSGYPDDTENYSGEGSTYYKESINKFIKGEKRTTDLGELRRLQQGLKGLKGDALTKAQEKINDITGGFGIRDDDMWRAFLGLEQTNNTVVPSKYKPTKAKKKNAKYQTLRDDGWKEYVKQNASYLDDYGEQFPTQRVQGPTGMANFTVDKGVDEQGEYYSVYDKYDFGVPGEKLIGKPYEIYDRIYLDKPSKTTQAAMNRYKNYNQTGLEEYSLGGILGDAASGAGTGAALGTIIPGVGNVVGGIIGGVAGLGKGLFAHSKEMDAEGVENAELSKQKRLLISNKQMGQMSDNPYLDTLMAYGGTVPKGLNAKLELDEIFITPDGRVGQTNAGPHGSGSDKALALPEGTKVISTKTRDKKGLRYLDRAKKDKDVATNLKKSDVDRNTAKRNIHNIFNEQETRYPKPQNMQYGGLPEHGLGDIVGKVGGWLGKNKDAIGAAGNFLGGLAPIAYNIGQSRKSAEKLNPNDFHNPYDGAAMDLMKDRRMDINPMLRANEEAYASAVGNVKSAAQGRGQLLGNLGGLQRNYANANAQAYAGKQNADLGYMGEQAQFMAQRGDVRNQVDFGVADINARNVAARDNFGAAAAGQAGEFFQNQQMGANMRRRDDMLMPMYENWMRMLTGKGGNGLEDGFGADASGNPTKTNKYGKFTLR